MLVPVIRVVAGFLAAVVVALLGDFAARVFNLSVGFQWDFRVHQNLQIIVIGAGAGVGAMLAWGNLNRSTVRLVSSALFAVLAGVAGAYVGVSYGPGVDTSYWWSRYATDITIHLAGAALSAVVAATLGLIEMQRARTRLPSFDGPLRRDGSG